MPGHVTCRSVPTDLHRALGVCAIGCFQSAADHDSDGFSRLDGKTVELADGNLPTDLHRSLAMGQHGVFRQWPLQDCYMLPGDSAAAVPSGSWIRHSNLNHEARVLGSGVNCDNLA